MMITNKDIQDYVILRKAGIKKYLEKHPGIAAKKLLVIQVGDNPASNSYIKGKVKDFNEVGMGIEVAKIPDYNLTAAVLDIYGKFVTIATSKKYAGVILQLPVPFMSEETKKLIKHIPSEYDVDGLTGKSDFTPCTPKGVVDFLKYKKVDLAGKRAVVIGRSDLVGKPLAELLTDADMTVTLCHSKTNPADLCDAMDYSDFIFTCIDKIEYFNESIGSTNLVDIGLGKGEDGKLHGNYTKRVIDTALEKGNEDSSQVIISGIGGVGLLTRLALLENTIEAAENLYEEEI